MNLTVLIENQSPADGALVGEHGLSILIQAHGKTILFDTGASPAVVRNADRLGLAQALSTLDAVVVSHGHSDHAGGLSAVLERAPKPTPVHIRPGFFHPRISTRTGEARAIGVPWSQTELEARGARFVEEHGPREILPGFWLSGEIPLREESTPGEPALFLGTSTTGMVPDPFTDEHALAVMSPQGLVVLVGCAHRGLVNSVLAAQAAANNAPIRLVAGGAHLHSAEPVRVDWTVDKTRRIATKAALGHCTGLPAEARFAAGYGEDFHPLRIGWRWMDSPAHVA